MIETAPSTRPLPEPLIELVAQRFRVLGEPMRIKLLDRLRDGDATVGELQQALGASQQNVSKHLGILHSAGMVARTKVGTQVRYAISDPSVFALCDQVCGGVRRQILALESLLPESEPRASTTEAAARDAHQEAA
jgi:DNA-binding transcriptional ArsR family regulator